MFVLEGHNSSLCQVILFVDVLCYYYFCSIIRENVSPLGAIPSDLPYHHHGISSSSDDDDYTTVVRRTRQGTDRTKIADLDLPPPRDEVIGRSKHDVIYANIDTIKSSQTNTD